MSQLAGGEDAVTATSGGWGMMPPIQNNGNDWGSSSSAVTSSNNNNNSSGGNSAGAAAAAANNPSASSTSNNTSSVSQTSAPATAAAAVTSGWATSTAAATSSGANVIVANNSQFNSAASTSVVSSSPKPTGSWAQAAGKGLLNSSTSSGSGNTPSAPTIASVVAGTSAASVVAGNNNNNNSSGANNNNNNIKEAAGSSSNQASIGMATVTPITVTNVSGASQDSTTPTGNNASLPGPSGGNQSTYSSSNDNQGGGYGGNNHSGKRHYSMASMPSTTEMINNISEEFRETLLVEKWGNAVIQDSPWNLPPSPPAPVIKEMPLPENTWKPTKTSGTEIWELAARQKRASVSGGSGGLLGPKDGLGPNALGSLGPGGMISAGASAGGAVASGQPWGNGPATNIGGTWGEEEEQQPNHWSGVPSINNAPGGGGGVGPMNSWASGSATDMSNGLGAIGSGAVGPNSWNQMDMVNGMGGNKMAMSAKAQNSWSNFGVDYTDSAANNLIAGNALDDCTVPSGPGTVGPPTASWNKIGANTDNTAFGTWNPEKKEQAWEKNDDGTVDDGTSVWGNCRPAKVSNWKDGKPNNGNKNGFNNWNNGNNGGGGAPAGAANAGGKNVLLGGRSWNEPGAKPGMWNNSGDDGLKGMNGGGASWMDQQQGGVGNANMPLWSNDAKMGMAGLGKQMGGGSGSGSMTPNNWADGQVDTSSWSAMKPSKPLVREMILASRQYRMLFSMGFKKEDIENALRNHNLRYEEAFAELQRNAKNPNAPFDEMRAKEPMNNMMDPSMNYMGNKMNSNNNMMLGPMRNQPMGGGGNGNGGAGAGAGGNGNGGAGGNGNGGGNPIIQNEQQITQLYARIQHAVADGYLNSQILNQQLSNHNLAIVYQLLQRVRQLQLIPQNPALASHPNIGKHIAHLKAEIALLQSQLQFNPNGQPTNGGNGNGNGAPGQKPVMMNDYFKAGAGPEQGYVDNAFDFPTSSNSSGCSNNGQPQQQQQPLTSRLNTWKGNKQLNAQDSYGGDKFNAAGGSGLLKSGGWSGMGNEPNMELWSNMGTGQGDAFIGNPMEQPYDATGAPDMMGMGGKAGLLDEQGGFGGFMKDSSQMYAWGNGGGAGPSGAPAKTTSNGMMDSFGLGQASSTWSFNSGTASNGSPIKSKNGGGQGWNNSTGVTTASDSFLSTGSTDSMWSAAGGSKSARPPPGLSKNGSHSAGTESTSIWSTGLSPTGGAGSDYLRVRNLTPQVDGTTLRTLCMQHGSLMSFNVFPSHAMALARFPSRDQALKAQTALNNCSIHNTTLAADCPTEAEVQEMMAMLNQPVSTWSNGSSEAPLVCSEPSVSGASFHRSNTISGGYSSAGVGGAVSNLSIHTSSPALTPYGAAGGNTATSVFSAVGQPSGNGGSGAATGGWSSATGASGLWETGSGAGASAGGSVWSSAAAGFDRGDRSTPIQNYLPNDLLTNN